MWEAVANEAELALLDVLFDGIEKFFFGDLYTKLVLSNEPTQMSSW